MLRKIFQSLHKFRRKLLKRAPHGGCFGGVDRFKNRVGILPSPVGHGDACFFRTVFEYKGDIALFCALPHNGIQRCLWKQIFLAELFLRMNLPVPKSIKKSQRIIFDMKASGAFVVESVDNVGTAPEPVYIFPFLIQNVSFFVFCVCGFCI